MNTKPTTENVSSPAESLSKPVKDSLTGNDRPISAKRPETPFSLVLGAYPIGLALVLLLILVFYAIFRG
ncbi:MAG: hypothetical protein U0892_16630 [Pirellulales bacterium]